MRSLLFAALAATVAAAPAPLSNLAPRACVPPPTNIDGSQGPFKISVGSSSNPAFAGNFAGTIPKRVNYIVFQFKDPNSSMVGDFSLDADGHLLLTSGATTQYAYYAVPPRYVALSPDAGVAGKITCVINADCELDCSTPNGRSTDCLGSPKVSPEWRIGGPQVVKPGE